MVPTRMDPPEHTPYRQALNNGLGLAHIRKIEGKVRSVAQDLIAEFAPRGECDFSIEYARIFPVKVWLFCCAGRYAGTNLEQKNKADNFTYARTARK